MKFCRKSRLLTKILIVLIAALIASLAVICFASCKNHEHNYERSVETEATCAHKGIARFTCSCGDSYTEDIPQLPHNLSLVRVDADFHRQECSNCDYAEENVNHQFTTLVEEVPSKCDAAGHKTYKCACGETRTVTGAATEHVLGGYIIDGGKHYRKCDNCNYETEHETHTYSQIIRETPSTCLTKGKKVTLCVCGQEHVEELDYAEHNLTEYVKQGDKHYLKCANADCDYKTDAVDHVFSEVVQSEPSTCLKQGYEVKKCACGETTRQTLGYVPHDYSKYVLDSQDENYHIVLCKYCDTPKGDKELHVTDSKPASETQATCKDYATAVYHCNLCGYDMLIVYEEDGYAPHDTQGYAAVEPTETSDGRIAYFQCKVCGKYFRTHGATEELTWDDIVLPKTLTVVQSYGELEDILLENDLPVEVSEQKYQITLKAGDYFIETGAICWVDPNAEIPFVNGDLSNVDFENADITIKFNIYYNQSNGGVGFANVTIVNVSSATRQNYSLQIKSNYDPSYSITVKAVTDGGESYDYYGYMQDYFWADVLKGGSTVRFECRAFDVKLKSLVINGKSYSVINGVTEDIAVSGDISAEFVFAEYVQDKVVIEKIDTSVWNAPIQTVNPYVGYEYDYSGSPNDYGRLYKGSVTRFYVDNAYITKVTIVYQDYEIDAVAKNTVNASTGKDGYPNKQVYAIADCKAVFNFGLNDKYTYFEYNADASQTRIVSITIEYETYNTFGS